MALLRSTAARALVVLALVAALGTYGLIRAPDFRRRRLRFRLFFKTARPDFRARAALRAPRPYVARLANHTLPIAVVRDGKV